MKIYIVGHQLLLSFLDIYFCVGATPGLIQIQLQIQIQSQIELQIHITHAVGLGGSTGRGFCIGETPSQP